MRFRLITVGCLVLAAVTTAQAQTQRQETWQERKDRENAATSAASISRNGGRWDEKAEAERRALARQRAAAQPLTGFTHCDQAFCFGNDGQAYARNGDNLLIAPDGRTCNRSGSTWFCQ